MSNAAVIAMTVATNGATKAVQDLHNVGSAVDKVNGKHVSPGGEAGGGMHEGKLAAMVEGFHMIGEVVEKAADKLFEFAKSSIEAGEQMAKNIQRTGMDSKAYQEFAFACEKAGIGSDIMQTAVKEMQKSITNGDKELVAFGVDLNDLKKKTPEDQFRSLMERMKEIKDPAEKTAFAMAAFKNVDITAVADEFEESTKQAKELGIEVSDGALKACQDLKEQSIIMGIQMRSAFLNAIPVMENWAAKGWAAIKLIWDTDVAWLSNFFANIMLIPTNVGVALDWVRDNWFKLWTNLPTVVEDVMINVGQMIVANFHSVIKLIADAFTKLWHGIKTGSGAEIFDAASSLVLFPVDVVSAEMDNFKDAAHKTFEDLAKDAGTTIPEFFSVPLAEGQADALNAFDAALKAADDKLEERKKFRLNKDKGGNELQKKSEDKAKLADVAVKGSTEAYKLIVNAQAQNKQLEVQNKQLDVQQQLLDATKDLPNQLGAAIGMGFGTVSF